LIAPCHEKAALAYLGIIRPHRHSIRDLIVEFEVDCARLAVVYAAPGFVTDRHSAKVAGFTRPLFANLVLIYQISDSVSALLRASPALSQNVF
jgi:hypothetical protein